jgi:hypothetical protein
LHLPPGKREARRKWQAQITQQEHAQIRQNAKGAGCILAQEARRIKEKKEVIRWAAEK